MAKTRLLLKGDIIDVTFFPTRIGAANKFVRKIKKNSLEKNYINVDIGRELPQTNCTYLGIKTIRSVMFDISRGAVTKDGAENPISNIKVIPIVNMPYMSVCDFGAVVRENTYTGTFGEVVFELSERFRRSRLIFAGVLSEDFSRINRILLTPDSFYYIPESLGSPNKAKDVVEKLLVKIVKDSMYYSNFIEFFRIFSSIAQSYGLVKGAYDPSKASMTFKGVDFVSIHSVLGVMV